MGSPRGKPAAFRRARGALGNQEGNNAHKPGTSETWRKLEADARHRISQVLSAVAYGWESNPYA